MMNHMKQYMKRYELKNRAKDNLAGKYGTLILGSFLFSLINAAVLLLFAFPYILSSMASMLTGGGYNSASFWLYQAGILVTQVLSGFLQFGIAYLCLNIVCGRPYHYQNVFFGFHRGNLIKTLILSVTQVLVNAICLQPCQYFANDFLDTRDYRWLAAAALALIIGGCIYIPVSLALNITYYLLLDFPDKKATEIIRDSFRVIKGHRMRLFLLQCSFIPLYLLCELSLGIGFLWLTPYMSMTLVLFYLDLMNPKEGNI